jgi:hypothetical protein
MAPEQMTHADISTWQAYYTVLLEQDGMERLRRIKSRLYEKLESLNEEIESLEEDRERIFGRHPQISPFIEREVEGLLSTGREVSIRLETVIGLLGEE